MRLQLAFILVFIFSTSSAFAQKPTVQSPNQKISIEFDFLPEGVKYKLTLIADGKYDSKFTTKYLVADKSSSVDVKLLRRGGFAASLVPVE